MIQQPFDRLVDSLAAKTPTPGGGAAAALGGCMGAALFLMVVRFSRGKKANLDKDAVLAEAEQRLASLVQRLLPTAERDCRSFDLVSAAYGMPKADDAQKALRDKAIQEAMVGAMVVPEEVLCLVRDVFAAMVAVVACVPKSIASDLGSGSALLLAAAEGAYLNVRINAGFLTDRATSDAAMTRNDAVLAELREHGRKIGAAVEGMFA